MIAVDLLSTSRNLVSIEDTDHVGLRIACVVGEVIEQRIPCSLDIPLRKCPKMLPGEDNVVAIDQQVFFLRLWLRLSVFFRDLRRHRTTWLIRLALSDPGLHRAVSALEYCPEFILRRKYIPLLLLKGSCVGPAFRDLKGCPAAFRTGIACRIVIGVFIKRTFFLRRRKISCSIIRFHKCRSCPRSPRLAGLCCKWRPLPPSAVHMHVISNFIPRHDHTCSVRAEN